jgi:3-hydroxyisobutyrate dehydrogenase-like beta-hydroxyacid dehydrogenase
MTEQQLGFVGLGSIGFPIMGHLVKSGLRVHVFDIDPGAVDRAAQLGAIKRTSAKEVADYADTVFVCLPTPEAAQAAVLDKDGIIEGAQIKSYIDHSTVGPAKAREICERLRSRKISVLDAPIAGGVAGAQAGELSVIIAGSQQAFDDAKPLIDRYAKKTLYIGSEPGQAQIIKLINNMIVCVDLMASAEAVLFGVRCGLSAATVLNTLNECTARSFATERLLTHFVLNRDFSSGFKLDLMRKDLRLCLEEANLVAAPMFLCGSTKQYFDAGVAQGAGARDVTEVVCGLEKLAMAEIAQDNSR